MTLKEKFSNYAIRYYKCEQIADDFAIGFAEWVTDSRNKNVKGSITIEELLEIYKIEKGL